MKTREVIRKRCRRFNDPGHAHELTFSCYRRRPFLVKKRTREYLAEAIQQAREKYLFHLWGYVLMPEHVHLLIWPLNDDYSISGILQSIKQSVSRKALAWLREKRPEGLELLATGQRHRPYRFWQAGGGYDRNVISPGTARAVLDYIHHNPVRRRLVESPEEWPASSACEWEVPGSGPMPVDRETFPIP